MPALTRYKFLAQAYTYFVEDTLPQAHRDVVLAAIPTLILDDHDNWARANVELSHLSSERLELACCGERGAVPLSPETEAVLDALYTLLQAHACS